MTAVGCESTLLKSSGESVMPILSIRAPKVAVKYLVVNHAKDSGRLSASPAKSTCIS